MVSVKPILCSIEQAARKLELERIVTGVSYTNHLFVAKVSKNRLGLYDVGPLVVASTFYAMYPLIPMGFQLAREAGLQEGEYQGGLLKVQNNDLTFVELPEGLGLDGLSLVASEVFELAKVTSEFDGVTIFDYSF